MTPYTIQQAADDIGKLLCGILINDEDRVALEQILTNLVAATAAVMAEKILEKVFEKVRKKK